MAKSYAKKKTIDFQFGQKHIDYIRRCTSNMYNIAEGAVRAGKTIDNVYAFAHELKTAPDKIHLATGSTAANAKLNIGDANGYGLEYIFRGQCRWGKYKGNECLIIQGRVTQFRQRIVIFAGASLANSFKKIRGNSYGMWIATEINLHHDNTIKEAFNRTLAAKRRKYFWDLNPDHPKADIYTKYIDKYRKRAEAGKLLGGVNYEQFTIFDNATISKESLEETISQYEPGTIWYMRDLKGIRCVAEGLIYRKLAAESAAGEASNKHHLLTLDKVHRESILAIYIGVDFGGTGSGHAFVASAVTEGHKKLIALASERHLNEDFGEDIDPEALGALFVSFVQRIISTFGFVTKVYCDSAEPVLIQGLKRALAKAALAGISVKNARKSAISNRIFALCALSAQGRFYYTELCETLMDAIGTAIWDPKQHNKNVRLDDGTSDIDSLDGFEYTFEREIKRYLPTFSSADAEDEAEGEEVA